jgi:hypothetical protein
MNSFKKIALAVVAAMTTATIVATPASAATIAISGGNYAVGANNGSNPGLAVSIPVPADNKVEAADALTIAVTNAVAGSTIAAVSENAKIVTSLDTTAVGGTNSVTSASGSNSVAIATGTGTSATFYVFTTTTEVGKVTVTADGNTTIYYVKGTAGTAYNLNVVSPEFAAIGSAVAFSATTTDVFGNAVETAVITTTVLRGTVTTALTWSAANKRFDGVITVPNAAGDVAGLSRITATAVTGLALPKNEVSFMIKSTDFNVLVETLRSDLAKEKASSATAIALANKQLADAKAEYELALAAAKANTSKEVAAALAAAEAAKKAAEVAVAEAKAAANTDINAAKVAADKAVADAVAAKAAAETLAAKAVTDTTTAVKDLSTMLDKVIAESKANADSSKKAFDEAITAQKDLLAATKASSNTEIAALKVELEKAAAVKVELAKVNDLLKAETVKTTQGAAEYAALKKTFNALATKWNKANPKSKVTLKK